MAKRTTRRRSRKRRTITPEDLGRLVFVSEPRISPDGTSVVFVHKRVGEKNEYASDLWIADADEVAARRFTAGGRDRQPRWSPDGRRIAFVGGREKRRPQIYTIDAGGGEATALTSFPEGSLGTMKWSPDGRRLAVAFREQDPQWTSEAEKQRKETGESDPPRVLDHWWYRLDGDGYFDAQRYRLYVVDASSGAHRELYRGDTLGYFDFDFSPDGRELVVASNRDRRAGLRAWNDDLLRVRIDTRRVKAIPGLPRGPKTAVAWSPDGKQIAYAGREGGDGTYSTENLELWVCDAARGGARCLSGREDYCLMAPPMTDSAEITFGPVVRWGSRGRRIYTQIGWHGEQHVASVRASGGRFRFETSGAFTYGLGNVSADGRRFALTVGSVVKPDEIAVGEIDGTTLSVRTVTRLNAPLLAELELARPTSSSVRTEDGTSVQVWTMLPPGRRRGRRLPAVLEIHGGPHLQYGVGFFHEFQVLAAAGYAVFYSNPRGSKGYGRDHCAAIRGAWGTADWRDIEAVTAFMRKHAAVDPGRMGVMGGSYGGYMTNWAIGHTDAFAGAITDRCVSNVVTMGGTSDYLDEPDRYFPGNFWDRPEARWEQSPIRWIGRARTPTLIIHSEGDLRCNIEQAEQVFSALTLLKVPTRFVRYPRSTSHGLSRMGPPDLRLHRLHQILEWWEAYL